MPKPRNQGQSAVHPSPGQDRSCLGDACYWYQVGCFIGCESCSSTGKELYPKPVCAHPMEPINNDPATRTWDPYNQSKQGDFTRYNPWRAPGRAPVVDSCGDASGYKPGGAGGFAAEVPAGYNKFDRGSDVLPADTPTTWKAGGTAEVAWAIAAQHGGGYSYRLCPKGNELTEACFQANHLSFANRNTTIRHHDGSLKDFQIPTTDYISPEGKQWRKNPIPGCACDVGLFCGHKSSHGRNGLGHRDANFKESHHTHVEGFIDPTPYAKHGTPTEHCPLGTMFEAAWDSGASAGFLVGMSNAWSIVDRVQVPDTPGEYVLSWRWDCEETAQVWSSCADITVATKPTPPKPPSPPPGPAPSPKPEKGCKATENPQCKGSPFSNRQSCWFGGCQRCHDNSTYDCDTCCPGCTRTAKTTKGEGVHYCDKKPSDLVV